MQLEDSGYVTVDASDTVERLGDPLAPDVLDVYQRARLPSEQRRDLAQARPRAAAHLVEPGQQLSETLLMIAKEPDAVAQRGDVQLRRGGARETSDQAACRRIDERAATRDLLGCRWG